jgi:hypothetical protein
MNRESGLGGWSPLVSVGTPRFARARGASRRRRHRRRNRARAIGGNAHILAKGDSYAPSLLTALTQLAGDLAVATSSAGSSGSVLNGLQTVGGSV